MRFSECEKDTHRMKSAYINVSNTEKECMLKWEGMSFCKCLEYLRGQLCPCVESYSLTSLLKVKTFLFLEFFQDDYIWRCEEGPDDFVEKLPLIYTCKNEYT